MYTAKMILLEDHRATAISITAYADWFHQTPGSVVTYSHSEEPSMPFADFSSAINNSVDARIPYSEAYASASASQVSSITASQIAVKLGYSLTLSAGRDLPPLYPVADGSASSVFDIVFALEEPHYFSFGNYAPPRLTDVASGQDLSAADGILNPGTYRLYWSEGFHDRIGYIDGYSHGGGGPWAYGFSMTMVPAGVPDTDGDGVPDSEDVCSGTPAGAVVDAQGCSIDQLVPCAGPRTGGPWRNHGQYVSAVTRTAEAFLAAGLITEAQKDAAVRAAAQSDCGKKALDSNGS
jgi:hypothetical protein